MTPTTRSDEAYRQAGVDLDKANAIVDIARQAAKATDTPHIKTGIGGFSGAFEIPMGYKQPVLLTGCDGVGTKLKLAMIAKRHDTIGIDLVAMSVNDILVNGGEPLVFLDYFATGALDLDQTQAVLSGVAEGCKQAGCALAGGETAEMPGFYAPGDYDLAGFCVGVAEKQNLYPKTERLKDGDILIGLTSSGLHSNGYSLARKVFCPDNQNPGADILNALLTPTRIYVKPVLQLLQDFPQAISAMAHITGGGFYDNLPRVLPDDFSAVLDSGTWRPLRPEIFTRLQTQGQLDDQTMWHTFNDGIGFVLVVDPQHAPDVLAALNNPAHDFQALAIGHLQHTPGKRKVTIFMTEKARLGILLSGRGSNFAAIAHAIEAGRLPNAEIAVVLSNKPQAGGLQTAHEKNIPTRVVKNDWEIVEALLAHNVDLVILAGYNRIVSAGLIAAFKQRILNIHPSLLPAYGGKGMVGMRVHQAVVAAGEAQSGCTVHVVIEDVDAGPVLGQAHVEIAPGDDAETVAAKVLTQEHRLYPAVIGRYIRETFFSTLSSHTADNQEALCFDKV